MADAVCQLLANFGRPRFRRRGKSSSFLHISYYVNADASTIFECIPLLQILFIFIGEDHRSCLFSTVKICLELILQVTTTHHTTFSTNQARTAQHSAKPAVFPIQAVHIPRWILAGHFWHWSSSNSHFHQRRSHSGSLGCRFILNDLQVEFRRLYNWIVSINSRMLSVAGRKVSTMDPAKVPHSPLRKESLGSKIQFTLLMRVITLSERSALRLMFDTEQPLPCLDTNVLNTTERMMVAVA